MPHNQQATMQSLVEKISIRTGFNKEKSGEMVLMIAEHVKQQFPLLHSVVDVVLGTQNIPMKNNKYAVYDFFEKHSIYS